MDRALAVSEADVADDAPVDHRLQDDRLEPRMLDVALDPDYRTRAVAPPDQLVMPRDAQAGALGQEIVDERPIQVGGAGSTHAEVTRFVWLRQFEPGSTSADATRATRSLRTTVSGPSPGRKAAADPCRIGRIRPMRTGLNPSVPRNRPAPSHAVD